MDPMPIPPGDILISQDVRAGGLGAGRAAGRGGHRVRRLVRTGFRGTPGRRADPAVVPWDPEAGRLDPAALEGWPRWSTWPARASPRGAGRRPHAAHSGQPRAGTRLLSRPWPGCVRPGGPGVRLRGRLLRRPRSWSGSPRPARRGRASFPTCAAGGRTPRRRGRLRNPGGVAAASGRCWPAHPGVCWRGSHPCSGWAWAGAWARAAVPELDRPGGPAGGGAAGGGDGALRGPINAVAPALRSPTRSSPAFSERSRRPTRWRCRRSRCGRRWARWPRSC